jgi:hypothetical protein
MRARRSIASSSLAALALAFAACSRDEEPLAEVAPEPAAPSFTTGPAVDPPLEPAVEPPPERSPFQSGDRVVVLYNNGMREVAGADDIGDVATPVLRRLVYQCSDDVTFAVRTAGDRLEVFPPGVSKSYIVFMRAPSDSGVRYTAPNAEFRRNGDLATLRIGSERYVDCVSNPAAETWGTVRPAASR